jgi:hypothetical protein
LKKNVHDKKHHNVAFVVGDWCGFASVTGQPLQYSRSGPPN